MADGLFTFIGALFTKEQLTGTPPIFLMHRFLASDREYAVYARYLQLDFKNADPRITFRVWQGLLPKGQGAPRFQYVVATKPKAAEELTSRMVAVLGESRPVVEEMRRMLDPILGNDLYYYYGVKAPSTKDVIVAPKKKQPPRRGGLLA